MPVRRIAVVTSLCALLLIMATLAIRGGNRARALTNCETTEDGITAPEQQMLTLINQARAEAGATPLKFSAALNRAAAWKSADGGSNGLGGGFSHDDSGGRPYDRRIRDCGYAGGFVGENIAYGTTSAQATFGMWMDSPGHRTNILLPSYRVIGIGLHLSAWTTDFGSYDDSSPTATASPTPTPTPTPRPDFGVRQPLSAGLNLVVYAGAAQPVRAALSSLGANVRAAYAWDAVEGRWVKFAPGLPGYVNSFSEMIPGNVYYIEVGADTLWSY